MCPFLVKRLLSSERASRSSPQVATIDGKRNHETLMNISEMETFNLPTCKAVNTPRILNLGEEWGVVRASRVITRKSDVKRP